MEQADDERSAASPPEALRDGVRLGILEAIELENRRTGMWVMWRLAAAGAVGIAAAIALTLVFGARGPAANHGWHLAFCGAVWTGLLVEGFAFVFLRIQTPSVPFAQVAALALMGTTLAALVAAACPEPHCLGWWTATLPGRCAEEAAGPAGSALCFGICGAAFIGSLATLLATLRGMRPRSGIAPALALGLLLLPAVVLQSHGRSFGVLLAGGLGCVLGSLIGIAAALALSARPLSESTDDRR